MITKYTKSNSQNELLQKEKNTFESEFTKSQNKKSNGKKLKRKINKSYNRKLKAEREYQ